MINDIYKKGFKIVNYEKVANWNISSVSELKIVLGRTEVINALRKKYYDIGESNSEKEYRKTLAELEELKKQNALSAVEYDQKVDSMSKSMMEWQKRLEIYALKFACINRDELDAMEKQAMEVLDQYSLIVKETQSMQEIELVENSLQQSLKEVKLKGELKKKAQLVFERIEDRKKWISIKEKI